MSLFLYAKSKGYLPRELTTEAELSKTVREIPNVIGTFSSAEMMKLLSVAPSSLRPFLALGGYAEIRHIEILRMTWEMLNWTSHNIILPADITKNRRRRVVPMLPALCAWLEPFRPHQGTICSSKKVQAQWKALAAAHSITWTHNVLRFYSFASYRVAHTANEAQTAREMGTSAGLIHSNYEDVKTPQEAAAWSSGPTSSAEVI